MTEIRGQVDFMPNPQAMVVSTTFNKQIHPALELIIANLHGVEDVPYWHHSKYSFNVIIGKLFDREEIAKRIIQKIDEYFSEE
jgi:hypothetical protein